MKINFNLESVGKDIAILKNKTTKKEKPIHVSESTEDVRNPFETIEAKGNEFIQLAPSSKDERSMIYVVGMSGSGKSYWTTQYVKEYLKKNKKNKVHLISPILDDKNINSLKPNRINPNTQAFLDDPPISEDFKNSILICDDIEAYDKKTLVRVMTLVNSIATTGRHHGCSLMFLAHTATNGAMSKSFILSGISFVVRSFVCSLVSALSFCTVLLHSSVVHVLQIRKRTTGTKRVTRHGHYMGLSSTGTSRWPRTKGYGAPHQTNCT